MTHHSSRVALAFILAATACTAVRAQIDAGVSLFEALPGSTTYADGAEHQDPAKAAGGLFEFRRISNPLFGFEATYSYNRANQVFSYTGTTPAGSPPGPYVDSLSANQHEITGDWVLSGPRARFQPFALAGGGLLVTTPAGTITGENTRTSSEFVTVFGFGFDWRLVSKLGFRVQLRDNVCKAANITSGISNPDFTQTFQQLLGAYYKF